MKQYNWAIPIKSLLTIAESCGLTCTAVDNGDGWVATATMAAAVREANACDEAQLRFIGSTGKRLWMLIVLGNEPEELICDYTVDETLEMVLEDYTQKWAGKACPTV